MVAHASISFFVVNCLRKLNVYYMINIYHLFFCMINIYHIFVGSIRHNN